MCLRRAPEKYIAGAALDRAALEDTASGSYWIGSLVCLKALLDCGEEIYF
jgi:hypothetical protein